MSGFAFFMEFITFLYEKMHIGDILRCLIVMISLIAFTNETSRGELPVLTTTHLIS